MPTATALPAVSTTFNGVNTPRTRLRTALLAAIMATATLAGCSASPDTTSDTATSSQASTPVDIAVPTPQVTLTNPGTGDLRAVRYVDLGATQQVPVTVGLGFAQNTGTDLSTEPAPNGDGVVLTATASATVDQGADATTSRQVTLTLTDVTRDDPALDVSVANGLTSTLGISGTGIIGTVSFTPPAGVATDPDTADPTQAEALGTVEGYLSALYGQMVIFPEDPIGDGATWTVDMPVLGESSTLQTTTYTLMSREGDTVTVRAEVAQRPAVTSLPVGDGSGQSLSISSTHSTGSGTFTVDLTKPLPSTMDFSVATRIIYGEGNTTRVAQDTWQTTRI